MTSDAIRILETVVAYCNDRWTEANEATPSAFPTADTLTGKKIAYNDLLQFARKHIAELSAVS